MSKEGKIATNLTALHYAQSTSHFAIFPDGFEWEEYHNLSRPTILWHICQGGDLHD